MLETPAVTEEQPENDQSRVGLVIMIRGLTAFRASCVSICTCLGCRPLPKTWAELLWEVQLTLTACLLGLAGGQIVAGPLSDALGRRRPLLDKATGRPLSSLATVRPRSVCTYLDFASFAARGGGGGRHCDCAGNGARFVCGCESGPFFRPDIGGQWPSSEF